MAIVRYNYKDPKEMTAFHVINEGLGTFRIKSFENKLSSKGNDMIIMNCQLRDDAGNTTLCQHRIMVNEWLAENMWRICEAVGKPEAYSDQGTNTEDLVGCAGKCKIKTETFNDNDSSKIHRFIPYKPMREGEVSAPVEPVPQPEDDIPF